MGSIYLIRHGQASFGADDYDVLSPTGIRQAEILGDHLLNLGVRFDRVLSGGLRRQQHTARAALERLESSGLATPELEVDPAFNEFEADAVIRAHLPDLLDEQPEALHILRHAAEHRAEFQRLFSTIIARWVSATMRKMGWKAGRNSSIRSMTVFVVCWRRPAARTGSPCSPPAVPLPPCSN